MLDNGRIVERGTHDELLELAGRYAALLSGAAVADGAVPAGSPGSHAALA